MTKAEMELLGFLPPRPGEDPRTGDNQIDLVDNGAFREIENLEDDFRNGLDVEQDPFMPQVTDGDGVPGYRPFVDASQRFTEADLGLRADGDENVEEREEGGDDLAQIVGFREAAAIGEDGRPVSDLTRLYRADVAAKQELIARAPYARINPESAYSGMLGGQGTLVTNAQGGTPEAIQVVNWVGEDVESCPVTLTLTPLYFTPAGELVAVSGGILAQAVIRWGTRDGTQEAIVDLGSGVQLTLGASAVQVSLRFASGSVAQGGCRLTASLAFYPCVRTTPLTFTSYATITNGGTSTIQRPAFASHLYIEREGTEAFTVGFYDTLANGAIYTRAVAAAAYLNDPIKLSNDVASIIVTNSGASSHKFRIIWGLHL
jgi:hypothetical protein